MNLRAFLLGLRSDLRVLLVNPLPNRLGWGRKAPPKPAALATTGSGDSKPAIEVITVSGGPQPDDYSKPANEVITGFLPEMTLPAQDGQRTASSSEAYRELIELELTRGRNAMGIYQDLVDRHGFRSSYQSVQRFVRKLRGATSPEARVIIETRPGEEAQVDYGTGPMVRDPHRGRAPVGQAYPSGQVHSFPGVQQVMYLVHE